MSERLRIRDGQPADARWLLALFDEAVAWMVARGQPEQWGSQPWSADDRRSQRVRQLADEPGFRAAIIGDEPVGAVIVGPAPGYVPVASRPELYVTLLLTSRRHAGQGIGTRLVAVAIAEARAAGREQLRVDCYAAPTLVAWYRSQGFTPSATFEVNGWPGQILELALAPSSTGA